MGKLSIGINGPVQGKVGSVIGSSWRGIPYIKGPYKKRTGEAGAGEAGNRNKFGEAQRWLKPLLKFVREGFKGYTDTVQGFIAAKSYLLLHAVEDRSTGTYINPALVLVSYGDLPLPADIAVLKPVAGRLDFSWDGSAMPDAHAKDQVMMLAYDVDHGRAYFNTLGQFRSVGADTLYTDPAPGRQYHVYCAFTAADRKRQSDSVYLGLVTM